MVNMAQLMKQAQAMQKKMADLQAASESKEFEGQAGGGSVKILINGKGYMNKIEIDPSMLNSSEKEILEDLIIAAFNDAKKKAQEDEESSMTSMMGGMSLPSGFKMPF